MKDSTPTGARCSISVCMPNYNYADYIEGAIESVLAQGEFLDELVVVDNASTDESLQAIRSFDDSRLRLYENGTNVGFALNARRTVSLASSEWAMLVSSDDRLRPGALDTFTSTIQALEDGTRGASALLTASTDMIDDDGRRVGVRRPPAWLWKGVVADNALSEAVGFPVYIQSARQALRRSLELMRNPVYLVSALFPTGRLVDTGGYRGGHLINPDKGFHWRLLAAVDWLVYVDAPLASYRTHGSNQAAQQRRAGALKHLVDEYCYTFEIEDHVLEAAGLTRRDIQQSFVHHDIALRGLKHLASSDRREAWRHLAYGMATYPALTLKEKRSRQLFCLLLLGPFGSRLGERRYARARRRALGEPQTEEWLADRA